MPVSSTQRDDDEWDDVTWWREPSEQTRGTRLLAAAIPGRLSGVVTKNAIWAVAFLAVIVFWFLVIRDDGALDDPSQSASPAASVDQSSSIGTEEPLAVPTPRPTGEAEVDIASEPDATTDDGRDEPNDEANDNVGGSALSPEGGLPTMEGDDFRQLTRDVLDFVHWIQEHPDVDLVDAVFEPGSPAHGHFANDVRVIANRPSTPHPKPTIHDVRVAGQTSTGTTVVALTSYESGGWLLERFGFARQADGTWRVEDHVVEKVPGQG